MPFRVSSALDLEAGRYFARLVSIEEAHSERYDTDFLIWHLEVAAGGELVEVSGNSSMTWGPRSTPYRWGCALANEKLDPKAAPAYESLHGRRVIATIGPNKNDYPAVLELEPFRGDTAGLVGFAPAAAGNGSMPLTPAPAPDGPPAPVPANQPAVAGWPMPAETTAPAEPQPTLAPDGLPF